MRASVALPAGMRAGVRVPAAALVLVLAFWVGAPVAAQEDPVKWSATAGVRKVSPGEAFKVELVAHIEAGWHLYSLEQPPPPIATKISVPAGQPFALAGAVDAPSAESAFDPSFGINTEFYAEVAAFRLPMKVATDATGGPRVLRVQARFQTCNDQFCLPPKTVTTEVALEVDGPAGAPPAASAKTPTANDTVPAEAGRPSPVAPAPAPDRAPATSSAGGADSVAAAPAAAAAVAAPSLPTAPSAADAGGADAARAGDLAVEGAGPQSLWAFIWLAMTVGALSLLTPCVFPMVPITVSYFTNHAAGSRAKAVQQAVTYMVGIILTFTALGMALALLVGATSLNRFAANPWINLLITGIFVAFALSLFGAFDLQVPPALVNRLDRITRRGGGSQTLATLLMGLTFTLTSFTCTAPFIGTLLVMAAGGDWQWPLLGMLAFSTVFALPFFILALMPQWMASLPRSGGWLNSVKVLMAFLEIAAAMKFLSNVDLVWGWGLFTRNLVLVSWVIIAALMAAYVLGLFRFPHDSPVRRRGPVRYATTAACLGLGIWLATGVAGQRLGEIEAFLPPAPEDMREGAAAGPEGLPWIMNDYDKALARGKQEGKRVFVDFTGYTCTNCRWMEANMFPREDVREELRQFVLVRLYTDGEGGIYERQQALQQAKYKTVALPYYAVVDPDGAAVGSFPGLTRDPARFLAFLKRTQ